jgi:UDP-N-acetylmuramoylalanine--D-glutamate ligase
VYLNLTPDHLDRYPSVEKYAEAKARIFLNQKAGDFAVVQKGLKVKTGKATVASFTSDTDGADYTVRDGWLCRGEVCLMRQEETSLRGPHNAENMLAAWAVAEFEKISREAVKEAFRSYRALPHRCELVRVLGGVSWVNDSKATNLDAMERAVAGTEGSVILIAGGKDKGFDFSESRKRLAGKVRGALLIGEMAKKIEKAWNGVVPCRRVQDLEEAVERAAKMAVSGETVLLSPGCSSYDMFKNFEERGEKYRQCVTALPEEKKRNE